jgi:hypothetical protein
MAKMGKSSMTMGEALIGDGKLRKRRKMKKMIKSKDTGVQSYKHQPVKRALKKIGSEIGEAVESMRVGRMSRKAMRDARRTGASDTCDPTRPGKCKTATPPGV